MLAPSFGQIVFLLAATVAVISALMMVTRRDMVHSVLWMVVTFFQIAVVYVMLRAEFLAVVQVMVYAGAILVLFLFVVMLLNLRGGHTMSGTRYFGSKLAWPAGLVLGLELVAVILLASSPTQAHLGDLAGSKNVVWDAVQEASVGGNVQAIGQTLFTQFLLPFETSSLILLLAVVGAVVLARKEEPADTDRLIPSAGISLGRKSVAHSPQQEQQAKALVPALRLESQTRVRVEEPGGQLPPQEGAQAATTGAVPHAASEAVAQSAADGPTGQATPGS
jgi:NADH-quinone oxidoreductase subunit J